VGLSLQIFNPSGCVAAVGGKEGLLYLSTPGNFTYGEPAPILQYNPPMTNIVSQYPHSQTVWEWGYVSQFLCSNIHTTV